MCRLNRLTSLLCLSFALPLAAQAGILYKCTNENGGTTYTNNRDGYRNCQIVSRDGGSASSSGIASTGSARPKASANPSPADFPKVTGDTQKARDNDRQRILEQEVASEQKGLDEARRSLAEQEAARAPADRLQSLRDRVALHTRNLDALRREIGKIR